MSMSILRGRSWCPKMFGQESCFENCPIVSLKMQTQLACSRLSSDFCRRCVILIDQCSQHCPLQIVCASSRSVREAEAKTKTNALQVLETGIYAPLTTSGDIIVNRYLVSCHSNLALKALQQTLFSVYRSVSQWIRDLLPKDIQDDAHLPVGIHYLASVADIFVPVSLL
ncbi:unnamed protein product [Heligmosomoides polygyrus]|uniref:Hint domain-containing protein n=1 Tax=Heligmosomoides polygyrus TaxID=6339 RepID=A0A183GHJ6_HELPZ|nr:unnamed protein product [Heligmosomoides polygyrus]